MGLIPKNVVQILLVLLLVITSVFMVVPIARAVSKVGKRVIPAKTYEALAYHWMLRQWAGGKKVCDIYVVEDEFPSDNQIKGDCGEADYLLWLSTPPCDPALKSNNVDDLGVCEGIYIQYIKQKKHLVTEWKELPPSTIAFNLLKCQPSIWCDQPPVFLIVATEPLEAHTIYEVHVKIGDEEVVCQGNTCRFKPPLTDKDGVRVEYWALSTFGDATDIKTFRLRNLKTSEGEIQYRVELLGENWSQIASSCSLVWDSFPSLDKANPWILQPEDSSSLYSKEDFVFLAGQLIWTGQVDASACEAGGLVNSYTANTCGLEKAAKEVEAWQNKYDQEIFRAATTVNVPAYLLKGLIAQEAQFWSDWDNEEEYGLGQITERGADLLLTWNVDYYVDICATLYSSIACAPGYSSFSEKRQAALRGKVLSKVRTDQEIMMLAETLYAACGQSGQLVSNVTGLTPVDVTTYEDMWAITLALYHSGAGCVSDAIEGAWESGDEVAWGTLVNYLSDDCLSAEEYVDRVLQLSGQ